MNKVIDRWNLSEDGATHNTTTESPFGTIENCTVDINGGYVAEKEGNGLSPNNDLLGKYQNNIRERFDLESPNEETDDTQNY